MFLLKKYVSLEDDQKTYFMYQIISKAGIEKELLAICENKDLTKPIMNIFMRLSRKFEKKMLLIFR